MTPNHHKNGEGIAIWSDCDKPISAEVHANLWNIARKGNGENFLCFLDLGIKVQSSEWKNCRNRNLNIYFPCHIDRGDVFDLGAVISRDHTLLTAIFNDALKICSDATSPYTRVTYKTKVPAERNCDDPEPLLGDRERNEKPQQLNIYSLTEANIEVILADKGSVVQISIPNGVQCQDDTYIRLRVSGHGLQNCFSIYKVKEQARYLSGKSKQLGILDFRLNSLRHMPQDLVGRIESFKITRFHFFYICSYRENQTLSMDKLQKARRLEDGIWERYIRVHLENGPVAEEEPRIAYHWKLSEKDGFNILIKTEYSVSKLGTIILAIIVIIIISVMSNLLTDFFLG